ncbi:hypothetical protein GJ744_000538 [Endocarpon pusillum]|uniref:SnoaL-like domain-containing protein n=1 Tax=Endocarpon pusillum TaxID=364733 RepID=A0A8H7E044_9EURO|nr:hypothetical protein GJ744_000538 [Endocarpon pusillum]
MQFLLLITALLPTASAFTPLRSATDELQIRNKLSLYAIALDTKNLVLLDQVFTPDAVIVYPGPAASILHGLPALKTYLGKALTGFVTQHTLSTTVVEQTDGREGVNSTVYLVANYLGQGNLTGSVAYFHGTYFDVWTKQKGEWKSKARTLELLPPGPVGNLAILSSPN